MFYPKSVLVFHAKSLNLFRCPKAFFGIAALVLFLGGGPGAHLPLNAQTPSPLQNIENSQAEMVAKEISLESTVAELNGRIEELNFALETLKKRVDSLATHRSTPGGDPQEVSASPLSLEETEISQALEDSQHTASKAPSPKPSASPKEAPSSTSPNGQSTQPSPSKDHVASSTKAATLPDGTLQEQYVYARSLLSAKRYSEAEKAFSLFIKNHPDHEMTVNAIYWLGETYYAQGKFQEALNTFAGGYDTYKTATKAPDLLLKLSMTLEKLSKPKEACLAVQQLLSQKPLATSIQQAGKKLSDRLQCTKQ